MRFSAFALFAMVLPMAANCQALSPTTISSTAGKFWDDSERGWFWYEDRTVEQEPAPPKSRPQHPQQKQPAIPKPPEIVQFEKLQKELEDLRKISIMNPTEENVMRYMQLEAKVVAQASYFADVAQRVAWRSPELDQTLQGRPVNAKAIEVFDREQEQDRTRSIAALAKDHAIFFFFRSDCPYCHAFAPVLQAFQAKYGINVVAISIDGGAIPGFPSPRRDNGIARTLNVNQVPATFLAQPFSGKISPIGFGVLSESQLLERISTVSEPSSAGSPSSLKKQVSLQ